MRSRPSARLVVLDPEDRVLLFRFRHTQGALAGRDYWATPGGGLEPGETFPDAARRELFEETGIRVEAVGPQVGERHFVLQLADGEHVMAEERLYLVRIANTALSQAGWTDEEMQVMAEHRWWSFHDLEATTDTVYPEDMAEIVRRALAFAQE